MKDWIYGFFMAWGMFLTIPCPFRRWRESARGKMLVCLPLVGVIVGAVWGGLALLLGHAPAPVRALLLAAAPWLCTGFMHLDGYMDVCDAVLSCRDLATRQNILKDSHCGAFAVIAMTLLALGQWSFFLSAGPVRFLPLLLIPVATRACTATAVLCLPAMSTSQYAAMEKRKSGYVLLPVLAGLTAAAVPLALSGSFAPLAAAAVCIGGIWYGTRQLGGMSGDISGFALTLGELCGCAAAILWR